MNMNNKDIEKVNGLVDGLAPELRELALYIHANPEMGMEEFKACQAQTDLLKKYGFEVEVPYAGFETGYRAVYKGKKPGPKIAMLAEYDALPELGHGCGHNLIAMVSVGAGIVMKVFADLYGGEIYVYGTPAEETAGTKVEMAAKGVFDEMDVAMMAHPMHYNFDSMNTQAVNSYLFKFYGKTAHAAATPEEGINALDAVINFFNMVNALRQQTKPDARIHGIITKGGEAPNIIPDYAEAHFYVRAAKSAYLEELSAKVIDCAKAAALGTGAKMEWEFNQANFKDTVSNMRLSDLQSDMVEALGEQVIRMNGAAMPGSSDLGDVSYVCPAIQCTFEITDGKDFGAHTKEFAECAGSEYGIDKGLTYVKSFVLTAIELMKSPEILAEIKEEFSKIK